MEYNLLGRAGSGVTAPSLLCRAFQLFPPPRSSICTSNLIAFSVPGLPPFTLLSVTHALLNLAFAQLFIFSIYIVMVCMKLGVKA